MCIYLYFKTTIHIYRWQVEFCNNKSQLCYWAKLSLRKMEEKVECKDEKTIKKKQFEGQSAFILQF